MTRRGSAVIAFGNLLCFHRQHGWASLSAQVAHEGRGATHRGQRGEAAGAIARSQPLRSKANPSKRRGWSDQ